MADIQDLAGVACGTVIPPGIKTKISVVALNNVVSIPDAVGGSTLGDALRITDDVVLAANKFWASLYVISETGELKVTQVGTNTRSFTATGEFMIVGGGPASDQWVQEQANRCFLALFTEKTGAKRLLGGIGTPVKQTASEFTTGKGSDTEKVWNITWTDITGYVPYYYEGAVDEDPLT